MEKDGVTSVTEIEFDYAGQRNISRLCFRRRARNFRGRQTLGTPSTTRKWKPSRNEYNKKLIRGQFTTIDNFRDQLRQALTPYKYEI